MARLVVTTTTDSAGAALLTAPRDDLVLERSVAPGVFEAAEGPFRRYRRRVTTSAAGTSAGPDEQPVDGAVEGTEVTDFRLALPVWEVLLRWPMKRALARRWEEGHTPWWSPPDRLDERQATVLALLCLFVMISGYLGTVITQTITFAADEFDASRGDQGTVLAGVRVGVLVSLVVASIADRRGRRLLLVFSAFGACLLTATGALVPNLAWLGVSQTGARALSTALAVLITIVAAEEMPRSSRAYAVSVLALTAALGAGMAVWFLPLADLGTRAWRILYVLPLAAFPLVRWAGRQLPESKRFEVAATRPPERGHGKRLALLAASAFLTTLFLAPASQFQNEFLREEQGYTATTIAFFTLATNTPGGLGIIIGGRLADLRGRRIVGAIALGGGVAFTVFQYLSGGAAIWVFSVMGAVIGAAAIPALGVYGPELFPTSARGRLNATISVVGVVGSALGLLIAGRLADHFDSLGPAISVLAIGPAILCVIVITLYPETAHLALEEINPEDAPVPEHEPLHAVEPGSDDGEPDERAH
jgi:MFS family permease